MSRPKNRDLPQLPRMVGMVIELALSIYIALVAYSLTCLAVVGIVLGVRRFLDWRHARTAWQGWNWHD